MAEEIDVGMKCIKYMLFVANFMFVMIGFLLISIGSTIKAIYGDFETFMAGHYFSPAILAIAIGVIIFFVALFGCVGAFKESTMLINVFAFFLTILLILEVSAAIAAYAMRGQIDEQIRDKMEDSIQNYNVDEYDRDIWDFTQQRLFCCGIDSPQDWYQYFPKTGRALAANELTSATTPQLAASTVTSVVINTPANSQWTGPNSCCRQGYNDSQGSCYPAQVFKGGCLDALTYIVSESALLLGCGALAVAFIQLLGIIFAGMLAKAVRRIKTQAMVERDENRAKIYEQLSRQNKDENPAPVLYTPTWSEA